MVIICKHEDGNNCVVDEATQTYKRIPDIRNKFIMNHRFTDLYDSIEDLIRSDSASAVVPMYCPNIGSKGKRSIVDLIDRTNTYTFFNIEAINGVWVKHDIDNIYPRNAYFVYLSKSDTLNQVTIKSVLMIHKNE